MSDNKKLNSEKKLKTTAPKKPATDKKEQAAKKTEPSIMPLNELNLKITNAATKSELINENGCTIVALLMQEDGKVLTSFLGDYNKEILKTLERVNKVYFKQLIKKLYAKDKESNHKNNKSQPE